LRAKTPHTFEKNRKSFSSERNVSPPIRADGQRADRLWGRVICDVVGREYR